MRHIITLFGLLLAQVACSQTWPEFASYNVGTAAKIVRFGAGEKWAAKTLTGSVLCKAATFGADPAPGVVKSCAVVTECLPSQLLGTGGRAIVSTNDLGSYVAWWCPGEPIPLVFACTTANCPLSKTKSAIASVFTGTSAASAAMTAQTTTVYSTALRSVWEPDWPKILAAKP